MVECRRQGSFTRRVPGGRVDPEGLARSASLRTEREGVARGGAVAVHGLVADLDGFAFGVPGDGELERAVAGIRAGQGLVGAALDPHVVGYVGATGGRVVEPEPEALRPVVDEA